MTLNGFKCEVRFFFFSTSWLHLFAVYFCCQLAWIHRSVQSELEAESGSGQLLSYPTAVSCCSAVVSTQSGHRSLKKTKGTSSFRQAQSGEADFSAYYDYNNGSNDCNVRGSAGRPAGINNTAEDAPSFIMQQ